MVPRKSSKSSSSSRKPSSRSRSSTKKKTTTRKSGSRASASRSKNTRRQTSTRSRATSPEPRQKLIQMPSFWKDLSLDRKLDIIGLVMALVGLLTLFGMLSATNSWLMGNWVDFLAQTFGWGVYFFPIGLMMAGGWLILRNFERLPQLSLERVVGLVLFLWMLLAVLHSTLRPPDSAFTYQYARDGLGGGYVGGFLMELLRTSLGWGGMVIALLAWALLSLAIILDRSVLALFGWVQPLVLRIQDAWDEFQANRPRLGGQLPLPFGDKAPDQPELLPVMTAGASDQISQPVVTIGRSPDELSRPNWVLPEIPQILDEGQDVVIDDEYDRQRAQTIEETLRSFGAPARVVEINRGPTITQFGVEPDFIESRGRRTRVRVGKIATLADDLALALAATRIRVEAPVPGKGYVGIEVPNEETALVALRDGIETEAFRRLKGRPLRFALGQDVAGSAVAADLAAMPHMLIAGTTGSGKSVCVNAIIACLLMHNTPDDLRMLMVDPKRVELTGYDGIPHLLAPVVVEMERVVGALQWTTREMDQRYHRFAEVGARNIQEFNARMEARQERKLPYLVVIIDELADLMMLAPDETERTITRMAQLARATGIHLVISTQRPSVDVVTGLIKANFPARIAFAVASGTDSRVILDQPGAERLLGRGDMLFQAPDAAAPVRLQGVFVSEHELLRLVQYWRGQAGHMLPSSVATAAGGHPDALPRGLPLKQMPMWDTEEIDLEPEEDIDPLFDESVDLIRRQGRASISMLQRRLRIGYTRAARLVENMEAKGIVGEPNPSTGVREVLDYGPAAPPVGEE